MIELAAAPAVQAAVPTGEVRALTVHDAVPAGCKAMVVEHDRFAPHLRICEVAIIDPDDREPADGEIYVVKITSPRDERGYRLRIIQLRPTRVLFGKMDGNGACVPDSEDTIGWMMHFDVIRHYPRPLTRDEMLDEFRAGRLSICDGPMRHDGLRDRIVGRVVGVIPRSGL